MFAREKLSHIVAASLLLIAVEVIAVAGYFGVPTHEENSFQNYTMCTQEAKLCPDGSAVSRTGPNCEFTPCSTSEIEQQGVPNVAFNQKAEELCGHQPPVECASNKQLGCDLGTKQWGCYSHPQIY